ncbi:3'-5' exoribonuclease [Ralstonia pseudosolanacearum]|nr:3'-5' exoribonuclease [Ralstonia pseudosolanacearum]
MTRDELVTTASTADSMTRGPRSPWKTRYFIDTEFTDFKDSQLISIAIVGEDGCEFYGERSDFELSACNAFVRATVLPQLGSFPGRSMPAAQLAAELRAWLLAVPLRPKPVLCYDSDCDYALVTHLLGGALPRGWKHENVFLKLDAERFAQYIAVHGGEHHALHDARANAFAFR